MRDDTCSLEGLLCILEADILAVDIPPDASVAEEVGEDNLARPNGYDQTIWRRLGRRDANHSVHIRLEVHVVPLAGRPPHDNSVTIGLRHRSLRHRTILKRCEALKSLLGNGKRKGSSGSGRHGRGDG